MAISDILRKTQTIATALLSHPFEPRNQLDESNQHISKSKGSLATVRILFFAGILLLEMMPRIAVCRTVNLRGIPTLEKRKPDFTQNIAAGQYSYNAKRLFKLILLDVVRT